MSTEQERLDREMQRRLDDGPAGLSDEALHYYNKWDALQAENARLRRAIKTALAEVEKLDGPRACRIAVALADAVASPSESEGKP